MFSKHICRGLLTSLKYFDVSGNIAYAGSISFTLGFNSKIKSFKMRVCNPDYDCIAQILTDGNAKLSKYKSKRTGMTISIAEVNGPLVGGYVCIATEAHDDDGLPHTLEHLVFMGSEKYPYKGVLDIIANRCLAQGTNAWTDTDHTCYTVTTAGDEGFLKLLPIYLDHLLYPTLTDSAYITEVHHVNGEGEDAGVVYCEMQARENSGESRCHLAMLRAMYPGKCGYKSETGGLMKNLRDSTSNQKVRDYHKEFYRPENLNVIIVGQIDAEKVFEAVKPVEERILQEGERPPFVRPWQTPVPELPESVTLEVEYPCDEDEYGLVIAAWRGPMAHDYSHFISVQILMDYFTDTSVSPLKREMVEIDDPFCNQVDYTVIENSVSCIYLHLSNVPMKKLKEVKDKLFSVLENVANGTEELDMERMKTLIRKKKLYILSAMENDPHNQMAACLIGDFLYGSTLEDLEHRVREIPAIDKLFAKDAQFWLDILKKYIIDGKYVVVLGNPSSDLTDSMAEDDKNRIEEQKKILGPDGLKKKAEILKKALEINDIRPPEEMVTSVTIPSVASIKFHPIKRFCNVTENEICDVDFNMKDMPVQFQLDVINTNFVRFYVLLDTSNLPLELRMYLPLFVELLDECAIKRDNEIVPYQDVVKELAEDTISITAGLGLNYNRFSCSQHAQLIVVELMVEQEKYEKSVKWVEEILYQIVFEEARIKSSVKKMIADVASVKRSGRAIVQIMMKNLCYLPESNHWVSSALRQCAFLTKLQEKLESNPEEIVAKLNEVRDLVAKPCNMTVHLAINIDNLKQKANPEQPWIKDFLPSYLSPEITGINVKKCHELVIQNGGSSPLGLIASIGSLETSFLMQTAPGIKSWTDPDLPPLLTLTNYLSQLEGPMCRQIRGQGLAYAYNLFLDPNSGLIYFVLYKCTHLVKAYKESLNIVESLLSGKTHWEKTLFESGTSSLIFDTIERFKTVADVAEESLTAYYRGLDINYVQELLEKISKVTESDLERVGIKYLKPLFDTSVSKCTVCCHPSKVKEIVENFKKLSRELTAVPSLDDCFMSKF